MITILENHNHRICRLCNKKIEVGCVTIKIEQSNYYSTLQSSFHLECIEKELKQGKLKLKKEKVKNKIKEEIKKLNIKLKEIDKNE